MARIVVAFSRLDNVDISRLDFVRRYFPTNSAEGTFLMKLTVLGVKRIQGTSSKTGNPFDMCNLLALNPIQSFAGKVAIQGFGYEVMEVNLDPNAVPQFSAYQGKFPVTLELDTEYQAFMGKLETVVTGIKAPVTRAA
jgi:hypothetical protein